MIKNISSSIGDGSAAFLQNRNKPIALRYVQFGKSKDHIMDQAGLPEGICGVGWGAGARLRPDRKGNRLFMEYSIIIPTCNGEKSVAALLDAIHGQTVQPAKILVVDSASEDQTAAVSRAHGAEVLVIAREDFDHGGTRDLAFRRTNTPYVIFMTQDALPMTQDAMERILAHFAKRPDLAIIGGRQVAYPQASPQETLVRAFNYPDQTRFWDQSQCRALGVRAYLISDVFAAYRRDAYLAVGGFDYPLMTNEDMLITQKLLAAGYGAGYAADACVYHSHSFTWIQQYRRNYIVGRTLVRYAVRFQNAQEMGEGVALVKSVVGQLLRQGRLGACIAFAWDCSARLLGNRMGRRAEEKEMKISETSRNTDGNL